MTDPKWKCYVKAVSPTHLVLTILPASFTDLKTLILSEDTAHDTEANFVNIVSSSTTGDHDHDHQLEEFDVEIAPAVKPELRNILDVKRQRSGSDVFEMTRPKLSTRRKHSGDAALMRDRTSSLDNSNNRPVFRHHNNSQQHQQQQQDKNDRNRCKSMDSKHLTDEPSKCSTPNDKRHGRGGGRSVTDPHNMTPASPWPSINTLPKYGSLALPVYLFDCNISGLTSSLLFKDKVDKPKNFYQNHLFKPGSREASCSQARVESVSRSEDNVECDHHDSTGHIDKEIKQRCHIIQMTYFKSFVQVMLINVNLYKLVSKRLKIIICPGFVPESAAGVASSQE